ncbi:folate-binding protein [Rickettsiaceae bacterium]|nr:folate-binding protein [Rickettsiaceae bacterium]
MINFSNLEILPNRASLIIKGPDAVKFLQGITTNDVIKNAFSYNYFLNNQGRYLFDFFVYKSRDDLCFLDIDKERLDIFISKLNMYKMRSDVEIEDISDEYSVVYSSTVIEFGAIYSERDPRCKNMGFRAVVASSVASDIGKVIENLYNQDKYKHAIVDGVPDLIYERSIPVEYGAEELNAIDYNKGCYIGQEVISRAKYQGVVRKKIFKLKFGAKIAFIASGTEITDLQGNKIGIVCSNYEDLAIALIREEKYLGLESEKAMINDYLCEISLPSWRQ